MDWLEFKEFIIDSMKLIIVVIIIMVLMIYVVSITQVIGDSMNNTLMDGEVLILNKLNYKCIIWFYIISRSMWRF